MLPVVPTIEDYRFEFLARFHTADGSTGVDFASADLYYRCLTLKLNYSNEWPDETYLQVIVSRGLRLFASPRHIDIALQSIYATLTKFKQREYNMPGTSFVPHRFSEFLESENEILQYRDDLEGPWNYMTEYGCTILLNTDYDCQPPGLIYYIGGKYDDTIAGSVPDIAWRLHGSNFRDASPDWDRVLQSHLSAA